MGCSQGFLGWSKAKFHGIKLARGGLPLLFPNDIILFMRTKGYTNLRMHSVISDMIVNYGCNQDNIILNKIINKYKNK